MGYISDPSWGLGSEMCSYEGLHAIEIDQRRVRGCDSCGQK